jgi:HSP20 family protein
MAKTIHPLVQKKQADLAAHPDRPPGPMTIYHPLVDIYESDKELAIVADMPGVGKADVHVDIRRDELVLDGHVSHQEYEEERILYREYEVGHWHRHFHIPDYVDRAKISADMVDGVLTVSLPKNKAAGVKRIKVRTSAE